MAAELTRLEAEVERMRRQNAQLRKTVALWKAVLSPRTPPLLRDEAAATVFAERAVDAVLEKSEGGGFVDVLAWALGRAELVEEVRAATRREAAGLRRRTGAHSRWVTRRRFLAPRHTHSPRPTPLRRRSPRARRARSPGRPRPSDEPDLTA